MRKSFRPNQEENDHYHFTPCEFFTRELADNHSLRSKWQQVSSGLQDSSEYSGRSQQYYNLDGLDSSSEF